MRAILSMVSIIFFGALMSGCFGDTETHRANDGKPDQGQSVRMKPEKE